MANILPTDEFEVRCRRNAHSCSSPWPGSASTVHRSSVRSAAALSPAVRRSTPTFVAWWYHAHWLGVYHHFLCTFSTLSTDASCRLCATVSEMLRDARSQNSPAPLKSNSRPPELMARRIAHRCPWSVCVFAPVSIWRTVTVAPRQRRAGRVLHRAADVPPTICA